MLKCIKHISRTMAALLFVGVAGNFLKLAPGSDLIGAGTPSGTNIGAR